MQNINRQSTYNYAAQLQDYICSALSASEWLQSLSVSFYPENSKDIEYQIKNALSRQGLACVVMTPRFSYIGHNEANCAWDARDITLNIAEFVPVNRASNKISCVTGLDIANYVVEYLGGPQGAVTFGKFCPKGIEQREDGKLLVTNITFDCSTIGDLSGVFDWDEEQHGVVISPYALESDLNELSVNVLDLSAIVADISSHSELSDYYTKSETSSAVELNSAFSSKADKTLLTDYLPLSGGNITGNLSLGNNTGEYNNKLTIRNSRDNVNVDIYSDWNYQDNKNTLCFDVDDGFGNINHINLPNKSGTIALTSDIDAAVSSKADVSSLNNYVPLSGGAIIQNNAPEGTTLVVQSNRPAGSSWLETCLSSGESLAMYTDLWTRAIYIDRNYEQRLQNKTGVIALTSDIDSAVSAKADKSALTNYVPLSGNATISGDIAIDANKFSITTPSCCLSVDGKKLVMWQTNLSDEQVQVDSSIISCAGEVHGRIGFFRGLGGLEQLQIQSAPYTEGQSSSASILECQTPWGSDAFTVKVEYDPDNFERILPRLKSYDGAYWRGFTLSSETMEMDLNTDEGSGKLKFPAKTGTLATTSDITQSISSYLPLSGGNITGNVNISRGNLTLKDGTGYVTKFDIANRTGGDASIVQYYESTPDTPITQLNLPSGKTGTLALAESIYTVYETISLSSSSTNKYQCDVHLLKTTKIDCSELTSDSTLHISFIEDSVYVNNAQYKYDIVVYNPNGCNLTLEFDLYLQNRIYSENGGASLNPGTNIYSFIAFRTLDNNIYFGKCTPLSVVY